MRFHLHPMDVRIQNFFPAQAQRLWKRKRIPIAERAQRSAQSRTISLEQARAHCHRENFELGTNQFRLINHSELVEEDFTALLISHIGSIFKDAFVAIWITHADGQSPFITIQAAQLPVSIPRNPMDLIPVPDIQNLLFLEFCVLQDKLELLQIESGKEGIGGKTVAALYSIAKDLNLAAILLDRTEKVHINARQFFFHTDFGAPEGLHSKDWIVKVDS